MGLLRVIHLVLQTHRLPSCSDAGTEPEGLGKQNHGGDEVMNKD